MRDISLHILDIAENSIRAGSSLVRIDMSIDKAKDDLIIVIDDNGSGMSKEMLERVKSPFTTSRTTRKVGLGIPLFVASCEITGGRLDIDSEPGKGTKLIARLKFSHIDRPPLGDIAETIAMLTILNPAIDFAFTAKYDEVFEYDTRQFKATLGDVPITNPDVMVFIREYLQEGIKQVFGGNEL
jgi:hypothetical protein